MKYIAVKTCYTASQSGSLNANRMWLGSSNYTVFDNFLNLQQPEQLNQEENCQLITLEACEKAK